MTKTINRLKIILSILIVILLINLLLQGPLEISTGISLIAGFLIAAIFYGRAIYKK